VREVKPWRGRKSFWRGLAIGAALDAALVTLTALTFRW
jgi:hypothetical protein